MRTLRQITGCVLLALVCLGCEPEALEDAQNAADELEVRIRDAGATELEEAGEIPFLPTEEEDSEDDAEDGEGLAEQDGQSPVDEPEVPVEGDHEAPFEEPVTDEHNDEHPDPEAPVHEDEEVEPWPPEAAGEGECAADTDCPDQMICTVSWGDCLVREGDERCFGFCVPADEDDADLPINPDDPCAADPDACADIDAELPGCREGEDPCEALFDACMEAVEAMEDDEDDDEMADGFDEAWCIEEQAMCQDDPAFRAQLCPGDEPLDVDAMCQEQLTFCLDGLDEEAEEDREMVAACYAQLDICKALGEIEADENFERLDACNAAFDQCLEAQDLDENADEAAWDRAFALCDEGFLECLNAPDPDAEAEGMAEPEANERQPDGDADDVVEPDDEPPAEPADD